MRLNTYTKAIGYSLFLVNAAEIVASQLLDQSLECTLLECHSTTLLTLGANMFYAPFTEGVKDTFKKSLLTGTGVAILCQAFACTAP